MTGARHIVGVVLAGGRSRRFGSAEKALQPLAGRPLVSHVIMRAAPQVARLVLNANGDPERFAFTGLPIVADSVGSYEGPLAGILAAMEWSATAFPGCRLIATFAVDSPFFPEDLVSRLAARVGAGERPAIAASGGRPHPVFGVWPVALRERLRRFLNESPSRRMLDFTTACRAREVSFDAGETDPFFNVNRPEDLGTARRLLAAGRAASRRPPARRAPER